MNLIINGEPKTLEFTKGTLQNVLNVLSIPSEGRIIEVNGQLFRDADFIRQTVQSGDTIKIIQFMGGG